MTNDSKTGIVNDEIVQAAADAYNKALKRDAFGDIGESQHFEAMQAALEAVLRKPEPSPMGMYSALGDPLDYPDYE